MKKGLWDKSKPWYKNLLFASWRDAVLFGFIIVISLFYYYDMQVYKDVFENPCDYCFTPTCAYEWYPVEIPYEESWNITEGRVVPTGGVMSRP